ncbi:MAG: hypothetical protein LBD37_02550 [Treponema sp.]|jgi:hypothetical protein|nr:hypothetical protein [Treponema sp.]
MKHIRNNKKIFGNNSADAPSYYTLITLETRVNYLLDKLLRDTEKNWYVLKELRALGRIINFNQWLLNHASEAEVRAVLERYEAEKPEAGAEPEDAETPEAEDAIRYTYEKKIRKNYKMRVFFIENGLGTFIKVESHRLTEDGITWRKAGEFFFTQKDLESILKRYKEQGTAGR